MPRTRRSTKRNSPPEIGEDEPKKKRIESQTHTKSTSLPKRQNEEESEDSSSDSDLEEYLKPADQIDLNSSFFQTDQAKEAKSFAAIENDIFAGINRLSDSDSEAEDEDSSLLEQISEAKQMKVAEPKTSTTKINFQQLHDYTKKLEEAKLLVAKYEASKKVKQTKKKYQEKKSEDISDLLAQGESKGDSSVELQVTVHSSDYESYSESEKEDWEEVEEHDIKEKSIVPKDGLQITVALPEVMRKKKGIDLVACMKRRLNRIRKDNQILVHKVHLLCWLGHGNYLNNVLNNEDLLALALSLMPSQHCYPAERTDLSYLEQIVKWYHNAIPNVDKLISKNVTLEKALTLQINRKQAYNKKMLVYIFICILRALGIQCRLILSFQVAPLRPPASELHSLSTKLNDPKENSDNVASTSKAKPQKAEVQKSEKLSTKDIKSKKPTLENLSKDNKNKNKSQPQRKRDTTKVETATESPKKGSKKSKVERDKEKDPDPKSDKLDKKGSKKVSLSNNKNLTDVAIEGPQEKSTKRSKSTSEAKSQSKTKKPDLLKLKKPTRSKSSSQADTINSTTKTATTDAVNNNANTTPRIPQVDGTNDSDSEPSTSKRKPKLNLKKLSQEEVQTCPKKHPKRLKSLPVYAEVDSDEDFKPKNGKKGSSIQESATNLKKLEKSKSNQELSKSPDKEHSGKTKNTPKKANLKKLKQECKPNQKGDIRGDIISIMKGRMAQERVVASSKLVKSRRSRTQSDYDSDYAPEPVKKKHRDSDDEFYEKTKIKVKQRVKVKRESDADEEAKKRKGTDVWVEVFLENEEKWISADVVKGQVHCVSELYSRASHPVTYIVAWNNNNSIKDLTQRYCSNWNTVTRKLRIDKNWWEATLRPYRGRTTARDKEEDEELARLQLEKPLPTTISEYKDHPLYVLKRHLLKFEALYPPEPITLGFIRNEPVYSRDCVHTLHSREVWIKYAKVVKPGEQPYKIVKARPKYDKLSGQVITDQPLEIFGKWQVDDYVPPIAENGIVPRNAYGNVELFKACMLPKGTVHLQLPGLNKVARKMNIDCAPAVVGFDFHSGGSHPTFDGFVVCEEHSESLIAGWYMEQEEQEKKEQEKIEKRVYGNWKKLIKGLLIRERLKARYNFGEPSQEGTSGNKKRKSKGPKVVSKKRRLCSDSESDVEDH